MLSLKDHCSASSEKNSENFLLFNDNLVNKSYRDDINDILFISLTVLTNIIKRIINSNFNLQKTIVM